MWFVSSRPNGVTFLYAVQALETDSLRKYGLITGQKYFFISFSIWHFCEVIQIEYLLNISSILTLVYFIEMDNKKHLNKHFIANLSQVPEKHIGLQTCD